MAEEVKDYDAIEHKNDQPILFFIKNINAKIESDATIPSEFGIHAYKRSAAKEILKVLERYKEKMPENVSSTRWYEKNTQNDKTADKIFQNFEKVIDSCMDIIKLDKFAPCETSQL